jgi:hypothetical protein
VIDRYIDPVELDTDIAGTVDVFGNVVELVDGNGELQQRHGQERNPRRAPSQARCLYAVNLTVHHEYSGTGQRQYRQVLRLRQQGLVPRSAGHAIYPVFVQFPVKSATGLPNYTGLGSEEIFQHSAGYR